MHDSQNNKAYVGDTTPLKLIRQAAKRDWNAILDRLPAKDRVPMQKRVEEMRQLAERADDFERGGYTEDFTGRILTHSYNLSKEGFREEVPKTIKEGDYGFCRTSSATSSRGATNVDYGALALKAVKTVGTHVKDGNYNQASLNAFYAKETELKAILSADSKNAGAKHYLDVMDKVKNAVTTNTALPMIDTSVKVGAPNKGKPTNPQYTSLTDHIAQYMKANGGDYNFISEWCSAQAGDSWDPGATRRKVVQLSIRGLNWDPPPPSPGVWYGGGGTRKKSYKDAVDYYKKDTSRLRKDVESVAQYKAAVQLLLENAEFDGTDKGTRTTILFRTEQQSVISGTKKGDVCKNLMGPAESFSVFRTVTIGGANHGTIARVPWSRINATYFMERTPRGADQLFYGESENEFNVDAIELNQIYVGKVKYGEQVSKFWGVL